MAETTDDPQWDVAPDGSGISHAVHRSDAPPPTGEGRTPREVARDWLTSPAAVAIFRNAPTAPRESVADATLRALADALPELLPSAPEGDADGGIDWFAMSSDDYLRLRTERLAAKVGELRAAGWDVVTRSSRDLALLQRDEARDELAEARAAAPEGEGARELRAFVESVAAQGCRTNRSESTRWCRDQMESARRAQHGEQPKTGPRWGSAGATGAFRDKIADGAELCLQCRAAELLASLPPAPEAREGDGHGER